MASMASEATSSGYCSSTGTYQSLHPSIPLPPESDSLSISDVVYSFFRSSSATVYVSSHSAFVDAVTGDFLSYSHFFRQVRYLSSSLRRGTSICPAINSGDVALILSPSSLKIPVLYFSLLSLGAVVSPANPLLSESELSHIVGIAKPAIAFTVTSTSRRLPSSLPTVILDSPDFDSLLAREDSFPFEPARFSQADSAAILYSSGTTGRIKGVELTHRNLIALITIQYHTRPIRNSPAVGLFALPLFHVFGFFMLLRSVALAETSVLLPKFSLEGMLSTVEKFKVTYTPVAPPVVVLLLKSELTSQYDLRSLEVLRCGGAPLSEDVSRRFIAKFPWIQIPQGYGLTETSGMVARQLSPEEKKRYGSVGRLFSLMEAKIVDPSTGEALPPGHRGEMWLRGPTIMKGFVYVVDRLKELIKYKGYQVPPVELESLLLSHPEVADAAVIPYPDEEAGQIPMAFVVRTPGSCVKGTQIMDFVSPYKKIRRVWFINAIPRSPQGKILRRLLQPQFARLIAAR
ncbi:hypothetical protein V2J09_006883 [Rumex salicifolius]